MRKILFVVLIIMTIGILIYNGHLGMDWFADKKANEEELAEINQEVLVEEMAEGENINPPADAGSDYWNYIKMPLMNVDISELKKINSDTVGFLSVNRDKYPVSCCTDYK